jgi:hypothetical protein
MIADRWVIRPQHHVGEVVGRVGYGRAVARCGRRLRGGTDEMRRSLTADAAESVSSAAVNTAPTAQTKSPCAVSRK